MKQKPNDNISLALVSNIIFDPHFLPLLKSVFASEKADVISVPYGEHSKDEYMVQLADSDMIVVWLNFEELFPDIFNHIDFGEMSQQQAIDKAFGLCERLYANIVQHSKAHTLWFSFEDYYKQSSVAIGHRYDSLIDQINTRLEKLFIDKLTFVDLKHLIADIGISNAYDPKSKYRWNAPYSKALIETAVKEIHKQYLIKKGITKKCLVLDCDNVLWGGILSEDGIENLKLGSSGIGRLYQDFQRFVLSLYYHGVILAICSKNDLPDVMTMFRKHSEMILKEEHIACFQVNWENKPDNIKRIADTLNIGLDSMFYVDDSPIEIEAVKAMLPEVFTFLYKRDTVYAQFSCFNLKSNISITDIEKRNETYRTNQSREALKSQYDSYDDYINALEIKIDIHEAAPIEFSRISELTQRTNKCTNGKRYTVDEIKERVGSENIKLYSLCVSDRFSDLGLVGALETEGKTLTLFSLSCRALGRDIEKKMLEFIADKHQINSIEFKSTGKNEDIKTLLLQSFPNAILKNCEIL